MDKKQLQKIVSEFTLELQDAHSGTKTSLPFLLHHLLPSRPIRLDRFQTIVIGGTRSESAFAHKTEQTVVLSNVKIHTQPVFNTLSDLLLHLESLLDPQTTHLGLNFAYPLTPTVTEGLLDGILLHGTKEHTFKGLVGKPVGQVVAQYFKKKYHRSLRVSVANDTICLLLSGLTKYSWEKLAAGVIGTGLNFAYFQDKKTAVNIESANFDKFTKSSEGERIDKESLTPGKALFEKEVAGAYLYHHFNLLTTKQNLGHHLLSDTKELADLAQRDSTASLLAQSVIRYSASLVATQIVGLMRFLNRPVEFIIEGSLFNDNPLYRETVIKTVEVLSPPYEFKFRKIEHSNLLGAALLF